MRIPTGRAEFEKLSFGSRIRISSCLHALYCNSLLGEPELNGPGVLKKERIRNLNDNNKSYGNRLLYFFFKDLDFNIFYDILC
jgi:hypothetical protein